FALAVPLFAGEDDDPEPRRGSPGGWPQWRGLRRDGLSPERGLLKEWPADGPELLWQAKNLGTAYSGVAVTRRRIYTMGDRDGKQFVLCLDARNEGKELWAAEVGKPHKDNMPGPRSTPVVSGGLVYAVTTDGAVVCLDSANGKEKWRKD